jgi:nitrogen fixation protein FixH
MSEIIKKRSWWPIGIISFFIVAIMYIGGFVIWASNLREDLVANNYYDNEIRYQKELDLLNRTQKIATKISVAYDSNQRSIIISLPVSPNQTAVGNVRLYRPSDERLDQSLPLALDAQGVGRFDAKSLPPGLWKIRIAWTVNGLDYLLDRPVVVGNPS